MLHLEWLQTYNLGYSPFQEPLPVGDLTTLLLGENGGGKTTKLRALQLLLGVRHIAGFDQYVYRQDGRCAEWAFARAIAGNRPDASGHRPFDALLPTYEDTVTLACLLERKGGWERTYYIVPGDAFQPRPGIRIDKLHVFKYEEYRQALFVLGFREALFNLLQMGMRGVPDELITSPEQRFAFFFKIVGDKDIWDRYQQAKRDLQALRSETLNLMSKAQQEQDKLAEWERTIKAFQRRRELERAIATLQDLHLHAMVRDYEHDLNRFAMEQANATTESERLQREQAGIELARETFQSDFQEWRGRQATWRREREAARQAESEANRRKTRAEVNHGQQQTKVAELESRPFVSLPEAEAEYGNADGVYVAQLGVATGLREERRDLEVTESDLVTNQGRTLPPKVNAFLAALQAEGIPHLLVADAVEVTD
jgi:hypothetical protein